MKSGVFLTFALFVFVVSSDAIAKKKSKGNKREKSIPLRPHIPFPNESECPMRRSSCLEKKTRLFPAKRLALSLRNIREEFLGKKTARSRDEQEKSRRLHQSRLNRILPRGAYLFTKSCPLRLETTAQAYNRLIPLCLKSVPEIRNFSVPGNLRWMKFPEFASGRVLLGSLKLVRLELNPYGEIFWSWKAVKLNCRNPFLALLRREHPGVSEKKLLESARVIRVLPRLVEEAKKSVWNDARRRDLGLVLSPGAALDFNASCPLRLLSGPARERGTERLRLELEIMCLRESGAGRFSLLVPGENERALRSHFADRVNREFFAVLKFSGFFRSKSQFRLLWDTIYNIRFKTKSLQTNES